ncbi:50S ribosomal protein L44e [Methanonatronarchaeum sp. AMET6-2]|uniref:50S ribosomal protein L44e n=1 Tax=Methanonatronarchaeum sp. AMET6-2 TaxID=2933293 RepID=UPI0012039BBE|nr:50S ribosomal protein L44e [Methanonatronarchaeum sp. AMET6-2]RZN62601.1 MAG: 50S ribosomal protein L44e [Methanonatronarchaeia archaeon]UOY09405.1 50S ribosomal protein L44e [Methanonatronarchaeum sp. AMET6-2]
MKMPRRIRTHCPFCNSHEEHEIEKVRKGKPSEMKWGQRQFRRVTSGYRGYPRPLPVGDKPTKKVDLRYRCTECNKSHTREGFRTSKLELEG